jgi:hypothetical protein
MIKMSRTIEQMKYALKWLKETDDPKDYFGFPVMTDDERYDSIILIELNIRRAEKNPNTLEKCYASVLLEMRPYNFVLFRSGGEVEMRPYNFDAWLLETISDIYFAHKILHGDD